jgi:aspartyl-tRNA synthetase
LGRRVGNFLNIHFAIIGVGDSIGTADNTKEVHGFVDDVRDLGGIMFIKLNTFSGHVQVTIRKKDADQKLLDVAAAITRQSCIRVFGEEREDPTRKGRTEMIPKRIEIQSVSAVPLPMDPSGKTAAELDTRLDWRSLDLRSQRSRAIFRVQSAIMEAMSEYFFNLGFVKVFTPSLMGSASESGSELFTVKYYDREAYLRQDPQLHRELAIIGGLERIFEIGPSWRAELSHTTRHLSEHRTCAAELSYINDESDVMKAEEEMVAAIFKKVKKGCKADLEELEVEIEVPKTPFPVLKFPELYRILESFGKKTVHGQEYDKEGEELLGKYVKEKYKSDFFFVDKFPFAVKPFYVMRYDGEPEWARSIDLIYKGVEMSSGGQREHRYDVLMKQIAEKRMNTAALEWFTKFFRYGSPTMGGFSIGIERLTMQILNIKNIKEVVLFPRDVERLLP